MNSYDYDVLVIGAGQGGLPAAPHGDDLLHETVAAMHGYGTIQRISKSIHVHPTLSEMVKSAAKAAR